MTYSDILTYISSEVLLLAQDSLIHVQLILEGREGFRHFVPNRTDNRVPLRILDTASLLELGDCAGLGGDQRGARSERGEVAADGTRLV